jgi:mannose-6-phosphate isomerase-like protein (cupin superfamily)/uncharacterized cupin superfamily protein
MIRLLAVLSLGLLGAFPASAGQQVIPARLSPGNPQSSAAPNLDYFFGEKDDVKPRKLYGGLEVYDLLTKCDGDPLRTTKRGAVLTGLNTVSYAVLAPRTTTKTASLSGVQQVLFVATGWGTIRSDSVTADIRQGFGIIIPPKVKFTITTGGDKPLTLYLIEEPVPKGFTPRKTITVKNDFDTPMSTNVRRAGSEGWLFGKRDGLASIDAMEVISFVPRSYVSPHAHLPGDEEIWIALDEITVRLGNTVRVLREGSAYKVPADGRTPHVNINDSRSARRLLWLARSPEIPSERAPSPRRQTNPRDLI